MHDATMHDTTVLLSDKSSAAAAQPRRQHLALVTLCLAVLIAQVDSSVANLATRAIGDDFHSGIAALQWVIDSYNLVYASLLLTGGLIADLYGRRMVFMAGAAVFTAASVLCAVAPSIAILLGGRALTGAGAAMLIPASLAIIRVVWPDERERGRALGIWAGCNGIGLAIGPTAGGFLINHFGWRSIFLVVVPLGLAAVMLARRVIPESADPKERHFDLGAQLLGALALGGFALAAIETHQSLRMAGAALVAALLCLFWFMRIEKRRGPAALVPLDLFRLRPLRGAVAGTAGMTFGMYGTVFVLPLAWFSAGRLDVIGAGLALMPTALSFIVVSPFSGALATRFGPRAMTGGGVAVIACGLATIAASAELPTILGEEIGLALTGIGMGFATGPLMGAAVGAVPATRAGTASSLINVARMSGATIGVAAMGTVYAVAGGGTAGLRAAMLLGAAVQAAGALVAWTTTPATVRPRR
jgi:DHA2 family methylenomycin A resistance protein-like MFS transporter